MLSLCPAVVMDVLYYFNTWLFRLWTILSLFTCGHWIQHHKHFCNGTCTKRYDSDCIRYPPTSLLIYTVCGISDTWLMFQFFIPNHLVHGSGCRLLMWDTCDLWEACTCPNRKKNQVIKRHLESRSLCILPYQKGFPDCPHPYNGLRSASLTALKKQFPFYFHILTRSSSHTSMT